MVSTVTNIPGHNQKVDSKVPKTPSADEANTQTSITGNEQVKEMAAVTLAEPSQPGPQAAVESASTDVMVKDEKALEAEPEKSSEEIAENSAELDSELQINSSKIAVNPQVPEPVLSAYNQREDRVGIYVDKIV
jgi:hypothetical protein